MPTIRVMADDDGGGSREMQQQYLGMLIELGATTLSIVGLNIQKWAHMVESRGDGGPSLRLCCCGTALNWRWFVGFIIYAAGMLIEAVALRI